MSFHFLNLCFFILLTISNITSQLSSIRSCLKEAKDIPNNRLNGRTLAGIIGLGWDDLQSVRTKPVFLEEFKLCRTEPTGHFLLPDTVVAIPLLKVNFDQMANYYEDFQHFKDEVSNTFVAAAKGGYEWLSASASFNKANEKTKENFVKYKSSLLYSKLQYDAFKLYQDSVGLLAPGFVDRIDQISDSLSKKLDCQAKYLAEMIVKDYGTHYISTAKTGAVIEQKIFIESYHAFSGNTTLEGIRIAAAAKFGTLFKASLSSNYSVSTENQQALINISKSSFLEAHGGPDINKILSNNATFNIDNVIPYNFDGDWLYQVISKQNFPNISIDLLLKIQNLLKNSIEIYYKKNTIHGCMNVNSQNFNFKANYDDGSCVSNNNSYPFDGIYQICKSIVGPDSRCDTLHQNNIIIGAPKCDETLFEPVKIFETIYEFEKRQEIRELIECRSIFCKAINVISDLIDKVKVEAFWCRKKENVTIPVEKEAMFGGVFKNSEPNLVTGKIGCPGSYKSYRIGRNTTVCLSYEYEQDQKYSIPFAGFFSYQTQMSQISHSSDTDGCRNSKNETINDRKTENQKKSQSNVNSTSRSICSEKENKSPTMKHCPEGYTQQLLPIEMSCNIFYCVKKHTVGKYRHPKIIRPPYSLPGFTAIEHDKIRKTSV